MSRRRICIQRSASNCSLLYIQAGKLIQAADVAGQLQQANPSDVDILYAAHQVYSELAGTTLYSIALLEPDSARMYQSKATNWRSWEVPRALSLPTGKLCNAIRTCPGPITNWPRS